MTVVNAFNWQEYTTQEHAKHGDPFDWFGRTANTPLDAWKRNIAAKKAHPVETCPYCVKGIADDDLECTFCFGAGKLT